MSIKGTFELYYTSGILKLLNNEEKSGELVVSKGKDEITVYFSEGNIVYATSTQKELRLGYFLINKEIITPDQHEMCMEISKARKSPLGKILLEKGYLTSVELKQIIAEQIEQIIFSLLLWEKGGFEFKESDTPHKGVDISPIDIHSLIDEASQRIEEMTVLLKQIPNDQLVFKMADVVKDDGEIKLNAGEWRILALVNGERTVRQLIKDSGFEEYEVYKVLSSLLATGHIVESDRKNDAFKTTSDLKEAAGKPETDNVPPAPKTESQLKNKTQIEKQIVDVKPDVKVEKKIQKTMETEVNPVTEEGSFHETEKIPPIPPASKTLTSKAEKPARDIIVDDDFSESGISEMVTVFIDIIKPIQKILENELGMEAYSIVDNCKRQLNSHQKRILKNFRTDNPSATNIHEIIDAVKESESVDGGYQLIIQSFNTLIQKILLKVPDILGVQPTRKMLQEIERVIYHIDNEQTEMVKKNAIIDGIKDILLETERVLSKQ